MKELAKKLIRFVAGDYSIYHLHRGPGTQPVASPPAGLSFATVDEDRVRNDPSPLIREQAGYLGAGAHAFACLDGERIAGICFYWFGERYRSRNFWPLAEGEAKLVQIITLPEMRGRGIARMLIEQSSREMAAHGFGRLYARVWHSNTPSSRAFERAGWPRIATVVETHPLGRRRPLRLAWGERPNGRSSG